MLYNRKNITLLTLLLFACFKLHAQDSTLVGQSIKWDLVKCIDYAKKNNIQINSSRLDQKTSQQEYLLAKAGRLPNLSATASQTFAHGNNVTNYNGTIGSGFTSQGSYGLNSNITIFNGGYINNTISQKNLAVQQSNYTIIQQENDITLQITQAYLAILLDKENITYYTDLVTTSSAQVKLEQQRYNVGSVARKDLIQLQAQAAADQYSLVSEKNTERGDVLTLKQLLLLPTDTHFDVVKPDTIAPTDTVASPLRDAEQTALQNRPEVKGSELGVQIADYNVKLAKAGYLPTLTGSAGLSSGYVNGTPEYFSQLNSNFYQQIGLQLTIPIFTKRVVKTQVEEAKINVDQAKLTLQDTKATLSQTVERAYLNFENAMGQYNAALVEYNYSKESYRIANEQLKIGVANTVDFLLQKNQYIQAQQALVQAKYNVVLTLKIYDFYKGIPITL